MGFWRPFQSLGWGVSRKLRRVSAGVNPEREKWGGPSGGAEPQKDNVVVVEGVIEPDPRQPREVSNRQKPDD